MTASMQSPRPDDVGAMYDEMEFDVLHAGYWVDPRNPHESWRLAAVQMTDEVLARLRPGAGDEVIDLGCGIGTPTMHIANATGARITGVTISDEQVGRANARAERDGVGGVSFQRADGMALPFADGSFDHGYALESIEHMDRPTALRELRRVVRPGGRIVLTDIVRRADAPAGAPSVLDELVALWKMTPTVRIEDYPRLVHDAGLELVELTDITANTLKPGFAEMVRRFRHALEAGDSDGILPADCDLTDPAVRDAIVGHMEKLAATDEIGYPMIVLTRPAD